MAGIHTAEDARLAVEHGVNAVWVSNHGARQIDGVLASIDILPEIVDAVQGRIEIYVDGGIRRGTSVFKALAMGATAVFIGRPVLWSLASKVKSSIERLPSFRSIIDSTSCYYSIYQGEEGVSKMLELLNNELTTTMTLAGSGLFLLVASCCCCQYL